MRKIHILYFLVCLRVFNKCSILQFILTFFFISSSTVGDIMMIQMMVTNMKYKAYINLVPVDCLILGQQLQQHEQAAEPQQQASWTHTQKETKRDQSCLKNAKLSMRAVTQMKQETLIYLGVCRKNDTN